MTAAMESTISSALMRWRFIERALHSQNQWSMEYSGVRVSAERRINDGAIILVAEFPAVCLTEVVSLAVTIFDGEDPAKVFVLDEALDETSPTSIDYTVLLPDSVAA